MFRTATGGATDRCHGFSEDAREKPAPAGMDGGNCAAARVEEEDRQTVSCADAEDQFWLGCHTTICRGQNTAGAPASNSAHAVAMDLIHPDKPAWRQSHPFRQTPHECRARARFRGGALGAPERFFSPSEVNSHRLL